MMTASELLQRHFETLVADPAAWGEVIADDLEWELVYAPSLGHPARLSGREAVERHLGWFRGAVEDFRFFDLRIYPFADPNGARKDVKDLELTGSGEAISKKGQRRRAQSNLFRTL